MKNLDWPQCYHLIEVRAELKKNHGANIADRHAFRFDVNCHSFSIRGARFVPSLSSCFLLSPMVSGVNNCLYCSYSCRSWCCTYSTEARKQPSSSAAYSTRCFLQRLNYFYVRRLRKCNFLRREFLIVRRKLRAVTFLQATVRKYSKEKSR